MATPGRSRRAWGWHSVTDSWAARIVAASGVGPGDLVLDVGAGHGALTRYAVAAGARVIAVELHPARVAGLRQRFAGQPVSVVQADARSLLLPHRPFRVVANPPFGLTTELVRILLRPGSRLVAADLVLQRAAVRRLVDDTPAGRWTLTAGLALPRYAFQPAPQVDAAVLRIRRG